MISLPVALKNHLQGKSEDTSRFRKLFTLLGDDLDIALDKAHNKPLFICKTLSNKINVAFKNEMAQKQILVDSYLGQILFLIGACERIVNHSNPNDLQQAHNKTFGNLHFDTSTGTGAGLGFPDGACHVSLQLGHAGHQRDRAVHRGALQPGPAPAAPGATDHRREPGRGLHLRRCSGAGGRLRPRADGAGAEVRGRAAAGGPAQVQPAAAALRAHGRHPGRRRRAPAHPLGGGAREDAWSFFEFYLVFCGFLLLRLEAPLRRRVAIESAEEGEVFFPERLVAEEESAANPCNSIPDAAAVV
eukprot:CAMPEP_0194726210 /NCGR_PEP_ID=MMETSP0296-20130528/29988_1 /TAXON_ID=39354 /ORGANISM="Heterosigma akashiwo, Strain CCMP2393" /LENGTH=301 /DNA_ID=CAMNT_0039631071 /DNA_START=688 /DNA_END=1593 /DNA_ORIENTATION=-